MKKHSYLIAYDVENTPTLSEILDIIKEGDIAAKRDAITTHIKCIINGLHTTPLIMPIVQYIAPLEDHAIKKLLFIFFEIIQKKKADGTVINEMLLACNLIRKDLLSSNEYIRAKTLKLVSSMMFREFLEPLIQPIVENLSHKMSYVRKNAILCLYSIFVYFGPDMMTDISDRMEVLMLNESDISTKRNAFILMFNLDNMKGIQYIQNLIKADDFLYEIGDLFQLTIIELVRKVCLASTHKSEYINIILAFNSSPINSVKYEVAESILQLTNSSSAIKLALQNYIFLLNKENDNNVKLIILKKLLMLNPSSLKLLEDYLNDICNNISNQSIEIKMSIITLIKRLINSRNNSEIVAILISTIKNPNEFIDHKRLIINCLKDIAILIPLSIPMITDFLVKDIISSDLSGEAQSKVLGEDTVATSLWIIKHAMLVNHEIRPQLVAALSAKLPLIKSIPAIKIALWLIGEFSEAETCITSLTALKISILPLPLDSLKNEEKNKDTPLKNENKVRLKTVIKPDGTYGTEIVQNDEMTINKDSTDLQDEITLRKLIREKDGSISSLYALVITKLMINLQSKVDIYNQNVGEVLMILLAIVRNHPASELSKANKESINMCISYLCNPSEEIASFIKCTSKSIAEADYTASMTTYQQTMAFSQLKSNLKKEYNQGFNFRQLTQATQGKYDTAEENEKDELNQIKSESIAKWQQLTSYSGPIYVEASVQFSYFNIVITLVVINLTSNTLQNVLLEIYSKEDVKLCERPTAVNIAPKETVIQKVVFKSGTTEQANVYGYYTLTAKGVSISTIPLNSIKLEFLEIMPSQISVDLFKKLWVELIWENKIHQVYQNIKAYEFYNKFMKQFEFYTISPIAEEEKNCEIFAVNLYGKREDLLLNLALEETKEGLKATYKMRSKTKSLALSLGELINKLKLINGLLVK